MSCLSCSPRARARACPHLTEPTEPRARLVHRAYLVVGSVGSVGMGKDEFAEWASYRPTGPCADRMARK
jgi:hypothetical protein